MVDSLTAGCKEKMVLTDIYIVSITDFYTNTRYAFLYNFINDKICTVVF